MILREFRGAWQRLMKRPGYAALSVLVLGIGLGLVLFLFSIVNSLILQPLPFAHADRLMAVGEPDPHGIDGIDSVLYLQLYGRLRGVDLMGAYGSSGISLDGGDGATYYPGCRLTASMLKMLEVQPLLGRGFDAADDVPGAPRVVLLGEALWRHVFHADPHIVGRAVQVNGEWATVVGVMPASFGFPARAQAWLPLRMVAGKHQYVDAVARLAPGIQLGQARAELDAWAGRLQRALPPGQQVTRVVMGPMSLTFVPTDMRHWVWLMFGAGVLVLLLACINVANLQLVQTLQRRHELALRSALGSTRARLLCGTLAESLLLSVAALALAFPILRGAGYWLSVTWTANHPDSAVLHHGIDGWVIAFSILAAVLSTLLAGGIPAWRASRADLQDALRDGTKGSGGGFARVAKTMVV
ncbi:MAG TPA: ABC transporter permease, partial [Rhodanobacter sp.]|nr:ABC transporter permease [Rhodanobacter sp.]